MNDLHNDNFHHENRTVAIVGLGYVGLPLALLFVKKGFRVLGVDLDMTKIERLKAGKSDLNQIHDYEVQAAIESKRFIPSPSYSFLYAAEAIVLCVPTPLTSYGTPDLSCLTQAAMEISSKLKKNQLIILESSTYPGTTREVLLPILNRSGLKVGEDFHVAYSPERVDPGNKQYFVENIPKVISGVTSSCLQRVVELYGQLSIPIHKVSSTDTAEMTKILENAYRLINISFMNEMAQICDALSIDVWEVVEAASTKPFGYKAFYPGPGIGGHCIPVDPSYLAWKINQYGINSDFIQLSNAVNQRMPMYITQQIRRHLAPRTLGNTRILVYGAAYKPDISDFRESASIRLIHLLKLEGADVIYHDPYVPFLTVGGHMLESIEISKETLCKMDAVIIATDHTIMPKSLMLAHAPFIYDTRNVFRGLVGKAKIVSLGSG